MVRHCKHCILLLFYFFLIPRSIGHDNNSTLDEIRLVYYTIDLLSQAPVTAVYPHVSPMDITLSHQVEAPAVVHLFAMAVTLVTHCMAKIRSAVTMDDGMTLHLHVGVWVRTGFAKAYIQTTTQIISWVLAYV